MEIETKLDEDYIFYLGFVSSFLKHIRDKDTYSKCYVSYFRKNQHKLLDFSRYFSNGYKSCVPNSVTELTKKDAEIFICPSFCFACKMAQYPKNFYVR